MTTAGVSVAQETALLLVETNLPGAVVYADSLRLGEAAQSAFVVPASAQRLRLVAPGGIGWSIAPVETALSLAPGDTAEVRLLFRYHYQIESQPFGAEVSQLAVGEQRLLGVTPLLYRSETPLGGVLRVAKPGYTAAEIAPGADVWNAHTVSLKPVELREIASAETSWQPPRRRRWIDFTAAAVALGAGALAVHYKFRADEIDDRYRETGDATLRDEVRALDTRSTIALGVMQGSLGVLALRFVLR